MLDLKLGSIPLRIQGRFFLMALLLGFNEGNPAKLVIWIAIVLVSVVIHELGHALVGRAFGLTPRIELHGMGGLTFFDGARTQLSTGKSILISIAGPGAGFLFAAVVVGAQLAGLHPLHPLARHAFGLLLWVNVAWGVFNLLPMLPLDGGNVLRDIARAVSPVHGEKAARYVSIGVAAIIALLSITTKQWWVLYLGVLHAFQNVQALRQADQLRTDQSLVDAIQSAHAAMGRGASKEAMALLRPALTAPASAELRQVGLRVFVAALVDDGSFGEAMRVLERERSVIGVEDLSRWSVAMRDLGREDDAKRIDELVAAPAGLTEFRA